MAETVAVEQAVSLPEVRTTPATRNVLEAIGIGIVLTALSYVVGYAVGWIDAVNYLEMFAVFTSYASTYLCVRERRWNYPFGIVSTAAYAVLFFQQGLMASALLNLYLAPSLVYGFLRWGKDTNTRPVTRVALKWVPVYLLVTAAAYGGVVLLMGALGASMLWADAVILVASILAQFLLDNKKIETWGVWVVVNIFAIYTYATAGLALAAFQYVFFLLNAFWGMYMWKKSKDSTDALSTV